MVINGVMFSAELVDILNELQAQLHLNGYNILNKIRELPDDVMVTCVYHKGGQESRPSAGLRKSDGQYHCFACGETHSLQEVISHCFGQDDDMIGAFGWKWLLKNFATLQVEERKDVEIDVSRNTISGKGNVVDNREGLKNNVLGNDNTNSDTFITEEELESYRFYHPYMYKRGLTDEVIELFDIGYDKNTHCITFPVRDINGNTLFIARRSVQAKYFHYPYGVEKPLYGLYELWCRQNECIEHRSSYNYFPFNNSVIICESMLDALSFWTVGKYAVALNGTGTSLQFKQLRDLPCRSLILCTDMDNAGMKARDKIRDNVKNKIVYEYFLPNGRKDANECTKEELMTLEKVL